VTDEGASWHQRDGAGSSKSCIRSMNWKPEPSQHIRGRYVLGSRLFLPGSSGSVRWDTWGTNWSGSRLQALIHPGGFNHGVLPISKERRYSLLLFFCIDGGLMWGRYFVPTHHQARTPPPHRMLEPTSRRVAHVLGFACMLKRESCAGGGRRRRRISGGEQGARHHRADGMGPWLVRYGFRSAHPPKRGFLVMCRRHRADGMGPWLVRYGFQKKANI